MLKQWNIIETSLKHHDFNQIPTWNQRWSNVETTSFQPENNVPTLQQRHFNLKTSSKLGWNPYLCFNIETSLKQWWNNVRILTLKFCWKPDIETTLKQHWFKILTLAYKALCGLVPLYICDLLNPYTPSRPLRSVDKHLLAIPRVWTNKVGGHVFEYAAPKLFNSLPSDIKASPSL